MPAAGKAEQSLSAAGLRFIAGFEGFSPRLYNDPGGHCTIGYGHLVHRGRCNGNEPEDFKREITREQGLDLLRRDTKVAERAVNQQVQVVLTQYQFDALVSFVFNVGAGAFGGSTLLRRLNQGEYKAVPAELMRWVNSGGRPLPGLVRRRQAEGVLFSRGSLRRCRCAYRRRYLGVGIRHCRCACRLRYFGSRTKRRESQRG